MQYSFRLTTINENTVYSSCLSETTCSAIRYQCNSGTCILKKNAKCDGVDDCQDDSDEADCGECFTHSVQPKGDCSANVQYSTTELLILVRHYAPIYLGVLWVAHLCFPAALDHSSTYLSLLWWYSTATIVNNLTTHDSTTLAIEPSKLLSWFSAK